MTPVADANRTAYGPDLADALVSLSDRESEAGAGEPALGTAQRAVTLCEQLAQTNPRAHAARSAAASLALGRRHAETHSVTGAVQHTEHAVSRYRELARASPLRFEPLLAEAETYHALALLAADRLETRTSQGHRPSRGCGPRTSPPIGRSSCGRWCSSPKSWSALDRRTTPPVS